MKKLFLLLMITAVVLTGCKKNEAPTADQAKGEVEFNVTNIMDDGSRTDIPGIPDCDLEAVADYAVVTITDGTNPITGSPFTMAISDIGDLMTDVLKLVPGTYFVTSFEVFTSDDDLIWAAPLAGSFYNDFMNIPLDLEFVVIAYEKHGYEVEVLCYDETVADQFGFTWFDIDKVVLRDICLFGDICLTQFPGIENWGDGGYSGEFDMPAQFQVTLYRAGATIPLSVYQNYDPTNLATYTDDTPLCIQYPDALEIPNEAFELVLEVYQPDGSGGFALYEWYTFTWEDDATVTPGLNFGDDNVIDFYVGDCYNPATPPDYTFPEPVVFVYTEDDDGQMFDPDHEANGWPYVSWVINGDNIDITFHNPTTIAQSFYFDYRIDDEAGHPVGGVTGVTIPSGPYAGNVWGDFFHFVAVGPGNSPTLNLTGTSKIQVRLMLGPERDYDFDWITFEAN